MRHVSLGPVSGVLIATSFPGRSASRPPPSARPAAPSAAKGVCRTLGSHPVAGLDPATPPTATAPVPQPAAAAADDAVLGQATLWQETAEFLQAGDIVLADQGTCFYGMAPHRLPADVTFVGQPLWASIGYTLPALLGACIAAPGRRGVLLIGDGERSPVPRGRRGRSPDAHVDR